MKINRYDVLLFFLAMAVGVLSVNSFRKSNEHSIWEPLSAYDYKEALEEKNSLYKEISLLEDQNVDFEKIIDKYKEQDNRNIIETMKEQLKDYNMLSGLTEVKGPGVVLKISDGEIDFEKDTEYERWQKIFHDNDMAMVINEIRNAGAEAFSLNNKRIMPFTGVSCNWAFLGFEDDTTEYGPFYIFIIGDPEKIEAALLSDESYISKLKLRGLEVSIEKRDEIVLKPTIQNLDLKFMGILDNK